jgi:deoxyribodipyrimidine photo-lyase
MPGGRTAALAALAKVKPQSYARSRNFLSGDVTRLSPYLRHGVLTLAEVRDHVLSLVDVDDPQQAEKLISELGWRDYWQRLYTEWGDGVSTDREPYKTGYKASEYASELPQNVTQATTTFTCIDSFSRDLTTTGYLHNHARMWFAAYITHWLRIRWQAGARWFLQHLLDGDLASNNLSWQWVASTFANKPYIFNRENLERYTAGVYCRACPHAIARTCPFEDSYEDLSASLFPRLNEFNPTPQPPAPYSKAVNRYQPSLFTKPSPQPSGTPLVWVHTDSMNSQDPTLLANPNSPAVFVWDTAGSNPWLLAERISLKRILFLAECLQEMPPQIEIRSGEVANEILAAARRAGATHILALRTPDQRILAAAQTLERHLPVIWIDTPAFTDPSRSYDLRRFSRYWQKAQPSAFQTTRS